MSQSERTSGHLTTRAEDSWRCSTWWQHPGWTAECPPLPASCIQKLPWFLFSPKSIPQLFLPPCERVMYTSNKFHSIKLAELVSIACIQTALTDTLIMPPSWCGGENRTSFTPTQEHRIKSESILVFPCHLPAKNHQWMGTPLHLPQCPHPTLPTTTAHSPSIQPKSEYTLTWLSALIYHVPPLTQTLHSRNAVYLTTSV